MTNMEFVTMITYLNKPQSFTYKEYRYKATDQKITSNNVSAGNLEKRLELWYGNQERQCYSTYQSMTTFKNNHIANRGTNKRNTCVKHNDFL